MRKFTSYPQSGFVDIALAASALLGLLLSVVLLSLNSARAKARDAKRIADVRQLSAALDLYKNDKNQYPNSLTMLLPMYIGDIPTAPTPPDGSCTELQNQYSYRKMNPNSYQITFCLGGQLEGMEPGQHSMDPSGFH